jgi:hypothetical protein
MGKSVPRTASVWLRGDPLHPCANRHILRRLRQRAGFPEFGAKSAPFSAPQDCGAVRPKEQTTMAKKTLKKAKKLSGSKTLRHILKD